MEQHTASNGIHVTRRPDGNGLNANKTNIDAGLLTGVDGEQEAALREFFRAEEDERLGRWRWPDNPDYVVYPSPLEDPSLVIVINERTADRSVLQRSEVAGPVGSPLLDAALAYFDAHPEPKPWHAAKPGEIWALGIGSGYHGNSITVVEVDGMPRFVWHVGGDGGLRNIPVDDPGIDYGRRVWPEGEPS